MSVKIYRYIYMYENICGNKIMAWVIKLLLMVSLIEKDQIVDRMWWLFWWLISTDLSLRTKRILRPTFQGLPLNGFSVSKLEFSQTGIESLKLQASFIARNLTFRLLQVTMCAQEGSANSKTCHTTCTIRWSPVTFFFLSVLNSSRFTTWPSSCR